MKAEKRVNAAKVAIEQVAADIVTLCIRLRDLNKRVAQVTGAGGVETKDGGLKSLKDAASKHRNPLYGHMKNKVPKRKSAQPDAPKGVVPEHPGPGMCSFYLKKKKRSGLVSAPPSFTGQVALSAAISAANTAATTATTATPHPAAAASSKVYCKRHCHEGLHADRPRAVCPYCKHSVYEKSLYSHMGKCSARPSLKEAAPYYEEGAHLVADPPPLQPPLSPEEAAAPLRPFKTLSVEELGAWMAKVHGLAVEGPIPKQVLRPTYCEQYFVDERHGAEKYGIGPTRLKHLQQQSSIVGHLDQIGMLEPGLAFVEMGCGKGHLSAMVEDVMHSKGPTDHFLVDRVVKYHRHKADNQFKGIEGEFARIGIDIANLRLEKVPLLHGKNAVLISKHLCGVATCLTLRCALAAHKAHLEADAAGDAADDAAGDAVGDAAGEGDAVRHTRKASPPAVEALVIATCCHHFCDYDAYCNHPYLAARGIGREAFAWLVTMSSWATCDFNGGGSHALPKGVGGGGGSSGNSRVPSRGVETLDVKQKRALGLHAKLIFDTGRVQMLREAGYDAKIVQYAEWDVSPECRLIIATPKVT
eukprot:gene21109-11235_t